MLSGRVTLCNGRLVHISLEKSGENSSEKWAKDVHALVNELSGGGVGVNSSVHHSLEKWLDDSDGWVNTSTRDT